MNNVVFKLFELPFLGRRLKKYIVNRTGMEQESIILREYTKNRYGVDVGMYTYGSCFSEDFALGGKVKVGRYCSIAANVHYFGDGHPMDYASTSPYFYNTSFNRNRKKVTHVPHSNLSIGNDCWIGYGSIITKGCHSIGNGSVIGSGAVVTKDVPPYAIVGGVPARILRYRFDQGTIEKLERSEWWDKTPEELLKYSEYIHNPQQFVDCLTRNEYIEI